MKAKIYFLLPSLLWLGHSAHAIKEVGNGGDFCEARIQDIRADIQSWLAAGGADGLKLPSTIQKSRYLELMQKAMAAAKISCVGETLKIGAAEKTCINKSDARGKTQIICNAGRFNQTPQADQYGLVHHEFAGIAGFEVNQGEESMYDLSRQLTGFLEDVTIKKLAVKPGSVRGQLLICDVENPNLAMFYHFRFFIKNIDVSGFYQDYAGGWFSLERGVPGLTSETMQTIVTDQGLAVFVQIQGQTSYRAHLKIAESTGSMEYSENDGTLQWQTGFYNLKCQRRWIDLEAGQDIRKLKF